MLTCLVINAYDYILYVLCKSLKSSSRHSYASIAQFWWEWKPNFKLKSTSNITKRCHPLFIYIMTLSLVHSYIYIYIYIYIYVCIIRCRSIFISIMHDDITRSFLCIYIYIYIVNNYHYYSCRVKCCVKYRLSKCPMIIPFQPYVRTYSDKASEQIASKWSIAMLLKCD